MSANPWEDEYFAMTLHEFKDSMACRYGKVPQGLQTYCDGCGDLFDMNHALNCKNGGLVYQRLIARMVALFIKDIMSFGMRIVM